MKLLTGDTGGEIMALVFVEDETLWHWKAKVEGSHATVAFSADEKKVYATTKDGVRIIDVMSGEEEGRIDVHDSNPHDESSRRRPSPRTLSAEIVSVIHAVTSSNPGWRASCRTIGTIETSTVANGAEAGGRSGRAVGGRSEWPDGRSMSSPSTRPVRRAA